MANEIWACPNCGRRVGYRTETGTCLACGLSPDRAGQRMANKLSGVAVCVCGKLKSSTIPGLTDYLCDTCALDTGPQFWVQQFRNQRDQIAQDLAAAEAARKAEPCVCVHGRSRYCRAHKE